MVNSKTDSFEQQHEVDVLTGGDGYQVILFNDDHHTFDEVIAQIIKAIHCDEGKASHLAMTVHNKGKAIVYTGNIGQCIKVSAVLEEIDLATEIQMSVAG